MSLFIASENLPHKRIFSCTIGEIKKDVLICGVETGAMIGVMIGTVETGMNVLADTTDENTIEGVKKSSVRIEKNLRLLLGINYLKMVI